MTKKIASIKQESSIIENFEINIPDFSYINYEVKDEYYAFPKEERETIQDVIQNKLEAIENNEYTIKIIAYRIIEHLHKKNEFEILRRDFLCLIDEMLVNLHIAYELPDPNYLASKCTSYNNFISEFHLSIINNFDLQESFIYFISVHRQALSSIKVFEMIAVYLTKSKSFEQLDFNENYIFEYDFQRIDKFIQVLPKEQLKKYKDFIIRNLQIDVSLNNVSKSEILTKIKDLYDYYIDIVPDSYQIYSTELIIHITHNALKNMGLKEDLIKFKNFLSSKKGVLKVEISHINDCSKKKIVNQYDFGRMFQIIIEKELLEIDINDKSLQFIEKKNNIPLKILLNQADDAAHRKSETFDYSICQRNKYFDEWYNELKSLKYFRKRLI